MDLSPMDIESLNWWDGGLTAVCTWLALTFL